MKQNLLTRFLTGLIVVAVFTVIFATSSFSPLFEIIVSLLICFCVFEAIRGIGYAKKIFFLIPSLVYAALNPLVFVFRPYIIPNRSAFYGVIILSFIYFIVSFLLIMFNMETLKFNDTTAIMFIALLISSFLSTLVYLRNLDEHGFFYMILAIVCAAWVTDSFAYLVGVFFGKHKLAPLVSPKKTIEGSLGGTLFCVLFFCLFSLIYQLIYDVQFNWPLVALYGLICSIAGQFGDLSFSMVKRSYGIKDFGNILPGHGGILDRMDSLIFIAPTFYMLLNIQPIIL